MAKFGCGILPKRRDVTLHNGFCRRWHLNLGFPPNLDVGGTEVRRPGVRVLNCGKMWPCNSNGGAAWAVGCCGGDIQQDLNV